MWFRRKTGNRRLGRDHVLDVRLRASQVRATRFRLAAAALGVVFASVLGVYSLWRASDWALNRLVYENETFAIDRIEVRTDGVLSLDQLRRWTGVRPGQNLFALDLRQVQRNLEMVSSIQFASVERILPRTLRVQVTEREPLARVKLSRLRPGGGVETTVFELDASGWVMLPPEPGQRAAPAPPSEPVPLLCGLSASEIQVGRRVESPAVQAALQFLQAFEHSPMQPLVDVRRVDVSARNVLILTTGQGSEITLGLRDPDHQLRRWRQIHDATQRAGKAIAKLDLAVSNNVPALLVDSSTLPAAPPKAPKTSTPRRKHV